MRWCCGKSNSRRYFAIQVGAQVIIDQFISSGEAKWLRMSGLVLLLPHGYEGQGPEHSSARLERYLQQSAEENWQVINCTTPANYFHALRRQVRRNFRKPLIAMTPKSLLRHKLAVSHLSDFGPGSSFHRVLAEAETLVAGDKVRRVVLCSGKVYYDLLADRQARGISDVAILRLEQLYPFPDEPLAEELVKYPNAEIVWCQEEPANMGAWLFADRRIESVLTSLQHKAGRPRYAGRPEMAATASGLLRQHNKEQAALIEEALVPKVCWSVKPSMTDIKVPTLGESVTEATVAKWLKQPGDAVAVDDPLVELETDKVTLEVNATSAGTLGEIAVSEGATVNVGALLGTIADGASAGQAGGIQLGAPSRRLPASAPKPARRADSGALLRQLSAAPTEASAELLEKSGPAARKFVEENKLDPAQIPATGKDGRLTKGDVLAAVAAPNPAPQPAVVKPPAVPSGPRPQAAREERVRMTRLRQRIAERLKEAQNTAAMLTTFNEVDMSHVMKMRAVYKEAFEKKHGVKLGFMSFFVKASIAALKAFPAVNAEIDGTDLVYKNYYDIGVAVSTTTGLIVPVVRDADQKAFAEIEKEIADLGGRARDGKLAIDELQGGTFTITNGGTFGSLMSTPILNPPQSAILGMHKIQDRPIAVDGKVEIRPMMYLAVSYDHRIVADGREAVSFLVHIKDAIEDPQRLLLDL